MSNKTVYFRQCKLKRKNAYQVSWIPEKYAVKDKVLKLRDQNDNWEDGWIVVTAGTHLIDEKHLPDPHSDVKAHRRATGDSLPK